MANENERDEALNELRKLRAMVLEAEQQMQRGEFHTAEEVEAFIEQWAVEEQCL